MKLTINQQAEREFEIKDNRRVRNEDKAWNRFCRRADQADTMIGELTRDGQTVCYIWPVGGKYREGNRSELVDFLIRNNYA